MPVAVESCIGACMILRKTVLDAVGGFDERFFFFFEETDLARTVRQAGREVFFVPAARIVHDQGQSAGHGARSRILFYRARYQYLKKWHSRTFALCVVLIGLRLAANTLSNGVAALLTLGLNRDIRNRFMRNGRVLLWHFTEPKALTGLDQPYSI
jgi:GT2 family glycosyltransferase